MTTPTSARYRTEARLGSGGMGFVSRVYDHATGRRLALKRLLKGASSQHVALFQREFYTLASLHHPHIIEVYDYGVDAEGPYYTMELLVGSDLSRLAPMPWRDVCRCLRDVASTLCVLHARRLVHRDLSPRNVWRTEGGTLKLLDFGALASFGTPKDVAGTPPFVPPEALYGQQIDQRADLYMLGALGFWLLTGVHAYPALTLAQLPNTWQRAPGPASAHMGEIEQLEAAPVPAELDALLGALLSHNPLARPADSAELIERLDSIAGFTGGATEVESQIFLQSTAFVGRAEERDSLERALDAARDARGSSTLLESGPGMGRTRLLEELALQARLRGAAVLHVNAGDYEGPSVLAAALAVKLCDALPEQARAAAQADAALFARLSPELQRLLGDGTAPRGRLSIVSGEDALRMHTALNAWFLALAREQLVAVLVDDVHLADEPSSALLASLAGAAKDHRLMLVLTQVSGGESSGRSGLSALRQLAAIRALTPLRKDETAELLQSVFGQAPHIGRLAERLHAVALGNPGYCMEIAEHLVRTGMVRHEAGMWLIPPEIPDADLPATRSEAVALRLHQLSPPARRLGQVLSLPRGALPLDVCLALSETPPDKTFVLLEKLRIEGILAGATDGYRFTHESLREVLRAELAGERLCAAHGRLGELLCRRADPTLVEQLHAGLHALLGGDTARGEEMIKVASFKLVTSEPHNLAAAVPALEQLTVLLREQGRSAPELIVPLSALAAASYFVDRRLAPRYAAQAIEQLSRALRLTLARRLTPWVGAKLGLFVALACAAFVFKRRKTALVPSFREAMQLLFTAVGSLTGLYTVCLDAAAVKRTVAVLEPLAVLGPDHPAGIYHAACACVGAMATDELGKALEQVQALLVRVQEDRPATRHMEDQMRRVRATMINVSGVLECWRNGARALELADRLDGFQLKLHEMSADQIRTTYHAYEGNAAMFERYRQRVETHAIARGSAWQVEIWAAATSVMLYLRIQDSVGMKRALEQLQRLSLELPSLNVHVRRARGVHLLLRGRHAEAIACLEPCLDEQPRAVAGWGSELAALARAYNGHGEHARAREVCCRALEHMTPLDLTFVGMYLPLQIELALAEAGLGQLALAVDQMEGLLSLHGAQASPLTLGALHEARIRIALLAGDEPAQREHQLKMEHWYKATGIPTLIQRCERVARESARLSARPAREGRSQSAELDRVLSEAASLDECTHRALAVFARTAPELRLYLFLNEPEGPKLVAQIGGAPPGPALVQAVRERLEASEALEGATEVVDVSETSPEPPRLTVGGTEHQVTILRAWTGDTEVIVAAAVWWNAEGARTPPPELFQVLAAHLHRTRSGAVFEAGGAREDPQGSKVA